MAIEFRILDIPGMVAGEDLSAGCGLTGFPATANALGQTTSGQYLIAVSNGVDLQAVHCSNVTQKPLGIIQNNPKSGAAVSVRAMGVSKVVAGGTLTAGDEFGSNAAGRAVKKVHTFTGANFDEYIMGTVLEGASAGELATVLVASPYPVA